STAYARSRRAAGPALPSRGVGSTSSATAFCRGSRLRSALMRAGELRRGSILAPSEGVRSGRAPGAERLHAGGLIHGRTPAMMGGYGRISALAAVDREPDVRAQILLRSHLSGGDKPLGTIARSLDLQGSGTPMPFRGGTAPARSGNVSSYRAEIDSCRLR